MNLITKEQLSNLKSMPGGSIAGVVLIKDYTVRLTKGGKEYIVGTVQSDATAPFKAWGNSSAFAALKNAAYENVPSYIVASVDDYDGQVSLILSSVQAVDGYTADQFLPVKYNIDAYWKALVDLVAGNVSPKGLEVCNRLLFANEPLASRFKVEFAAKSIHDNCKGGLLAHTYKVVSGVVRSISQYPALYSRDGVREQNFVDLLVIGALLHDIGKTVELDFGIYTPESIATHMYFGLEVLVQNKDFIVGTYDEDWYYQLVSIVLEHHGEFGERPKTVAAMVVHLHDVYEAKMTWLASLVEQTKTGEKVKFDDYFLTV